MPKFRLLDLGVKIELARHVSRAASSTHVDDQTLSGWVYRRQMANKPQTFNKVVAGSLLIDDAEQRNLAAALEFMIRFGPSPTYEADLEAFSLRPEGLALYPKALLGTIQDFAEAVMAIAGSKVDSADLAGVMRHGLGLDRFARAEEGAPLRILGQPDRLTPPEQRRRERDIDQAERDPLFLEPGTPLQAFVTPQPMAQIICAFELQAGPQLLTRKWLKAPWLGARFQPAARPAALLDADALVGVAKGEYSIQAIGFDPPAGFNPPADMAGRFPDAGLLPPEIVELTRRCPAAPYWPPGYAEMMALLIHAGKTSKKVDGGLRFYRGSYGVRVDPADVSPASP